MTRGRLDAITRSSAYADAEKDWFVTLQQSTCYWYELIVNPPHFADTKFVAAQLLNDLRNRVEQTLEKRFIYFFASRPKVRFDTTRAPRFEASSKKLVLHLLIGRDKKRRVVKASVPDLEGTPVTPQVEVSERFIRLSCSPEVSRTYPIHDFLQLFNLEVGASTKVHYVGITKDPADRPLSRKHRGITDTLYNVSNEQNDFFIFINLFKVMAHAENLKRGMSFMTANSMTDEIKTDEEGAIVEGALIAYFECQSQQINRDKEHSAFRRNLESIAHANKIRSVAVHMELEHSCEYFTFGSDSVSPSPTHTFVFESIRGDLVLTKLSSESDLLARLHPPGEA
jgi:hypothetical protein